MSQGPALTQTEYRRLWEEWRAATRGYGRLRPQPAALAWSNPDAPPMPGQVIAVCHCGTRPVWPPEWAGWADPVAAYWRKREGRVAQTIGHPCGFCGAVFVPGRSKLDSYPETPPEPSWVERRRQAHARAARSVPAARTDSFPWADMPQIARTHPRAQAAWIRSVRRARGELV